MDIVYHRIPIILKRFSFESKMRICQQYSRQLMKTVGLDILNVKNIIYPWELDVFALFSIMTENEYGNKKFENNNIKTFNEIISVIRNYEHPELQYDQPDIEFADKFMMATGLLQFKLQEDVRYRLFRYDFILNYKNNKINMLNEMKNKFGFVYNDLLGSVKNFVLLPEPTGGGI